MSLSVSEYAWVDVTDIKSSVKSQWVNFWGVSVWKEIFLDIVAKINIGDPVAKEQRRYRLLIENLVVYKGLSMRRMWSGAMRNKLKVKWKWKVSVKNREDDTHWEIARELTELSLEVSNTAIFWPVFRIWSALYKRFIQEEKPDIESFVADLVLKRESMNLWTLKSTSHRWNSFPADHDTAFEIDNDAISWNPTIYNISEIDIQSLDGGCLHTRINVPISWLNSDSAAWIEIITETIISILDDQGNKQVIEKSFWQTRWEYTYETIEELTPLQVFPNKF